MSESLTWSLLGGTAAMVATWLGVGLGFLGLSAKRFGRYRVGVDFALGAMTASAAFALVGPQLLNSALPWSEKGLSLFAGLGLVWVVHHLLARTQSGSSSASPALLAWVLILHGLPEGMASGAALAGLRIEYAAPILTSISLQNIPEGILVVVLLRSLGASRPLTAAGGLASGLVELLGGALGGLALHITERALPDLMLVAGGAMLASVGFELASRRKEDAQELLTISPQALQFALGFGLVTGLGPLLDLLG